MSPANSESLQPTRLPLQLRAIDHGDLPLISPVVRAFHKTSSNRIVPDVIPFLRIAFIATQNVIKNPGCQSRDDFNATDIARFKPPIQEESVKLRSPRTNR